MDEKKVVRQGDFAEKVARLRAEPGYEPSVHESFSKEQRLVVLEERLTSLEKVFDQNTAVFSDSLQLAELCIQALQRVLDDAVKDGITASVKTLEIDGQRKIDFKAYLNDALQQRPGAKVAEKPAPVAEQPVFEFGG